MVDVVAVGAGAGLAVEFFGGDDGGVGGGKGEVEEEGFFVAFAVFEPGGGFAGEHGKVVVEVPVAARRARASFPTAFLGFLVIVRVVSGWSTSLSFSIQA